MGCSQSKKAEPDVVPPKPAGGGPAPPPTPQAGDSPSSKSSRSSPSKPSSRRGSSGRKSKSGSRPEALYHHLLGGLSPASSGGPPPGTAFRAATAGFWSEANRLVSSRPSLASYVDPTTSGTPLHVACSLGSSHASSAELSGAAASCVSSILAACPGSASARDRHGHVPLEGVLAAVLRERDGTAGGGGGGSYRFRTDAVRLLLGRDPGAYALDGDAVYGIATALPDDFAEPTGPTVEFVRALVSLGGVSARTLARGGGGDGDGEGDGEGDGDDTLALLYRRFVRQFDQSERFFAGDNSRPEVVEHRRRFKNAAVNTFHVIEALLTPADGDAADGDGDDGGRFLVRNAVRADSCPPDLLRYIVETNLGGVADADSRGNLPLHYAAGYDRVAAGASRLPGGPGAPGPPESHSKYVIDELLYAYPDGASVENGDGALPVVLAVESGKKWIGGGVRSLHEAYPDGMARANLGEGHPLASAASFESQQAAADDDDDDDDTLVAALDGPADGGEEGTVATGVDGAGGRTRKRRQRRRIRKDESHDAIMFVQRPTSTARDVASVMWANEEDAGVAMLGCAALADRAAGAAGGVASVALHGVTAAVNAMKNHPNEPAVQERACQALTAMGPADGRLEVSFAASGAVSTVVSAMQAHVSDATVQREACRALRAVASSPSGGGGAAEDRATVVASVSGLTALANTMASHPDDAGVQSEAVRALEALVARGGGGGGDGCGGPGLPGLPEQTEALLAAAAGRFPEECAGPVEAIRASIAG